MVSVQRVENKGYGLVATQGFQTGQLITKERVLIKVYRSKQTSSEFLTANQVKDIFQQSARLPQRQLKRLKGLSCCSEGNNIVNIFKKNCITVDDCSFGVYLTISRINHSCSPNSVGSTGDTKEIRALRPIMKGEEITLSYIINYWDSQWNRCLELNYWRFKCQCEVCSRTGGRFMLTESLRRKINDKHVEVTEFIETIVSVLQDSELSENRRRELQCNILINIKYKIGVANKLLELVIKAGNDMRMYRFTAHLNCFLLYCKLRALGIANTIDADQSIEYHGQRLNSMMWKKEWRDMYCYYIGLAMMFSVENRNQVYNS